MRDSIIYSSFRAMFVTIFTILGIAAGLLLFILIIGLFSSSATNENITNHYKEEILANADWKREELSKETPVILQLNMNGVIGLDGLTTANVRQKLVESREGSLKDDRVKAVFIVLNSPGGTVDDANGIYQALKDYKAKFKVPVYLYTEGLCASGGMYIAAAADKIFANDAALIGSIGVILPPFWNVTTLLDKWGVNTLTLSAGKGKDAMSPFHPWKPEESKNYQEIINFYYNHFIDIITSNRPGVDKTKLVEEYGAQVFPAPIAQKMGYVDVSGSMRDDALRALVKELNIEDAKYQVIQLESNEWWNSLIKAQSPFLTGVIKHQMELPLEMNPVLQGKYLYLYRP